MGCIKPHDHNIFTCPVMKKGRPRITSAERVRYIEETRKKSVSGTKPSVSVPSWSEYVSRNKRKSVSEK